MNNVNVVAVILSAVASMILGSIWYSPKVFGAMWMKLEGITQKDAEAAKKEMPKMYGGMFVASLVMAYVLSRFVSMDMTASLSGGVMVGFWVWLGFVATSILTAQLASGKPMKLFYIQSGYYLVTLLVMGAIIGGMR